MHLTLRRHRRFPFIALLLTLLVALTGCSDAKRLWDIFVSTREGDVPIDRIWDIHEPNRRLLLVMVHGFNTSSDQAWGGFPRLIKAEKDTAFSGFNVLRYGYGSALCRNKVDIADRGDGLKSFLSDELKHYDGMIIMGHSLGGLVAMHGLIKLAKAHQSDLERIPVAVMTFGTPHLGVEGAERLGQMGFLCTDKQAEAAKVFDRSLDDLRVDWESYFGSNALKSRVTIRTFYGPEDLFVSQASACGRFPGCEQVDGENHVMIVKPNDTNHLAYIKLRVQVDSMTDQIYGPAFAKRSHPAFKEEQKLTQPQSTPSIREQIEQIAKEKRDSRIAKLCFYEPLRFEQKPVPSSEKASFMLYSKQVDIWLKTGAEMFKVYTDTPIIGEVKPEALVGLTTREHKFIEYQLKSSAPLENPLTITIFNREPFEVLCVDQVPNRFRP